MQPLVSSDLMSNHAFPPLTIAKLSTLKFVTTLTLHPWPSSPDQFSCQLN